MKPRMNHVQPREMGLLGNQQVLREIRTFLKALDSYPESFAQEPGITFEQHLFRVVTNANPPRRRD